MVGDPQNDIQYDSDEGIIRFSIFEFIRMFLYHVIYLQMLGPLSCLLIWPIEGRIFLKNAKFWKKGGITFNF